MKVFRQFSIFSILFLCALHIKAGEAKFTYDNHCLNNLIYFEDQSSTEGQIVSWFWNFGDESVSTDSNPVHAFSESGSYTVQLTIKTEHGESFTTLQPIEILTPPFAFFNPKELCNNKVEFNDNSFTRASEVKVWMWDFGDGNYSMEKNPSHQFVDNPSTNVALKIMDENGCGDSISQTVHLKSLPKTGFNLNQMMESNPAVIKIESINQKDSVFYLINNSIVNSKNPEIKVPASEAVQVKQKVINKSGCQDSTHQIIHAGHEYFVSMPATFQPNLKEPSNQYKIINSNVEVNQFQITNSIGKVLFNGTGNQIGWNGLDTNTKKVASSGIYFYSIFFENKKGTKGVQKGKFFLLQ